MVRSSSRTSKIEKEYRVAHRRSADSLTIAVTALMSEG
jgi:hypothetical protein